MLFYKFQSSDRCFLILHFVIIYEYNYYLFAIRPYDLLYITPIDMRHKKHSGLRGGEKNERK
jgi:hypothetical protein